MTKEHTKRLLVAWVSALALFAHAESPTMTTTVPASSGQVELGSLSYQLEPRQIAADTWVLEGAVDDFNRANGCNIINTAFIATGEGVIVINTGTSRLYGEQQRKAIEETSGEPVHRVINLNLHPDYFFGNQAWLDRPTQALEGTVAGQHAEGGVYADNLYRICGEWMKGTEVQPARVELDPGTLPLRFSLGRHQLELRRLSGHTYDDLILLDHTTGVMFVGGLVFSRRVPTTPHAQLEKWLAALDTLEQWQLSEGFEVVVPSHGPVHRGMGGIEETRDWLRWLRALLLESAESGLDLSEVLRLPVPDRFSNWAAQPAELHRTLAQWYPSYELKALNKPRN